MCSPGLYTVEIPWVGKDKLMHMIRLVCELKSLNYEAYIFDFDGILRTLISFLGKCNRAVKSCHVSCLLTPHSNGVRQNKTLQECIGWKFTQFSVSIIKYRKHAIKSGIQIFSENKICDSVYFNYYNFNTFKVQIQ